MVGELVRSDCEEVGLKFAFVVVMWQAAEKADKRLLDEVVAGVRVFDASVQKGAQPAFIATDELPPGIGIALADRLDQKAVTFIPHETSVTKIGGLLWPGGLVWARSPTVPKRGGRATTNVQLCWSWHVEIAGFI